MTSLQDPITCGTLVTRLHSLRPTEPPRWGRMTAHQMICHLSDSFRVCMGEKEVSPATGVLQRTVMKWAALKLPMKWPKGVATRPEVEQGTGGTSPVDFDRDREELIELLRRFTAVNRDFQWSPHPIFGMMKDPEWLRWAYLHMDHHLRQFGV